MAVKIRLRRIGTRNTPVFRVVVADSASPRDGKFIEEIGTYNPRLSTNNFQVKTERLEYWLKVGATPSDTVRTLLKKLAKTAPAAV